MMPISSSRAPDSQAIQRMFNRLASRYDLFNHLTSMGMAGGWRRRVLGPLRPGMRVLDLGCGTGDLALEAARMLRGSGEVVGLDFSEEMLGLAGKRQKALGLNGGSKLRWVLKKAEDLPLDDEPYDWVVSGFVLRNLYQNIDQILEGVHRSLRDGGGISFVDITEPPGPVRRFLWKFYMHSVVALYGKILFGQDYPSKYLAQSAERFLNAAQFKRKLEEKGFRDVRVTPMMFGVISWYRAVK